MSIAPSVLGRFALGLAGVVGIYAVLVGVFFTPSVQRFALYANFVNTLFLGDDLSDGEAFGFAKNQVTAFNLYTADGESLYAWHILPLNVYAQHETKLRDEKRPPRIPVSDIKDTLGFRLLQNHDAKVVVSFHGNAGHIVQNQRAATNRLLSSQENTHVISIDYRGFGHSTGVATESGLIADGVALMDWILNVAGVPSQNIVILGQSLGTAVSSAVALYFANPAHELIASASPELQPLYLEDKRTTTIFRSVILAAPFSSVPSLLLTYKIGGILPPLRPLSWFPSLADKLLSSQIVDTWRTAERLRAYYDLYGDSTLMRAGSSGLGSLQVLHAINDGDIPYHQTEMICRRILEEVDDSKTLQDAETGSSECIDGSKGPSVLVVKREGRPRMRFELVAHGGHNKIATYSPVAVAVMRAFGDFFD